MKCENYSTLYKVASCPCQEGRLFVDTVDTYLESRFRAPNKKQRYKVHLVFEMLYSKQREKLLFVNTVDTNPESGLKAPNTKQRYEVHLV